ncbi:MAG TPA: hypothetical protein VMT18_08640 [Planctomycetota bacterium]|nr:hypothetical protein [Planctomycetota bacterium]
MSHPRSTIALVLGLVAAGAVSWSLGGVVGTGVMLGFLLGAALCGFGIAWQSHWLRVAPKRAFQAQIEGFLVKLGALLVCAVTFRYVESLAQLADWGSFALSYGATVAALLPISTFETVTRLARATSTLSERSAR